MRDPEFGKSSGPVCIGKVSERRRASRVSMFRYGPEPEVLPAEKSVLFTFTATLFHGPIDRKSIQHRGSGKDFASLSTATEMIRLRIKGLLHPRLTLFTAEKVNAVSDYFETKFFRKLKIRIAIWRNKKKIRFSRFWNISLKVKYYV